MSARAETGPHCRCVRLTCPVLSSRCILYTDPHLGGVTMLRRVSVLALALALAACGDDGDDPIPPERMAIEILRGDNFRDTVYLGRPAQAVGAVVYEPVALGELEVSPEPLVAKFGER